MPLSSKQHSAIAELIVTYFESAKIDTVCTIHLGHSLEYYSLAQNLQDRVRELVHQVDVSEGNLPLLFTGMLAENKSTDFQRELCEVIAPPRKPEPPAGARLDAVLLCRSSQREGARNLAAALGAPPHTLRIRLWEDNGASDLANTLGQARGAILCFGSEDRADFRRPELGALVAVHAAGHLKLLRAFLPGCPEETLIVDPFAGLARHGLVPSFDLRHEPDAVASLKLLHYELTGLLPGAPAEAAHPGAVPPGEAPPRYDWQSFAYQAARYGIVVVVGCTLPDRATRAVPSDCDIAADLLWEVGLIASEKSSQARELPLLPTPHAAFIYRHGKKQPREGWNAAEALAAYIRDRSLGIPQVYSELARLLRQFKTHRSPLWKRTRNDPRLVVVTTNLDFSLERAFLDAGLAFSRVVHQRTRDVFLCHTVRPVYRPDGCLVVGEEPERTMAALRQQDLEGRFRAEYVQLWANGSSANQSIDFETFVRTRELNRLLSRVYDDQAEAIEIGVDDEMAAALLDLETPILFKLQGSYEDPDTWLEFAEEYLRREDLALPMPLEFALNNYPTLFVGFQLSELRFMNLYEGHLRKRFVNSVKPLRLALITPPGEPYDAQDRIDALIGEKLRAQAALRFRIQPLLQSPKDALGELCAAYDQALGTIDF